MARTALTPKALPGSYPATPLAADSADLPWEAADIANQNSFPMTGGEIVLVRNDNVGAQTVTFTSAPDDLKRSGDIAAYSLAAGEYAAFGPFQPLGWKQADGDFYLEASAADVFFQVLKP